MRIKDLVTIDEKAEFRNDVQLSDYDRPKRNLALLNSYLFTITAPKGLEPSLGLLRTVINSFLMPKLGNRMVSIANYGHGKSHLALVLTNYFSKPNTSEEMRIIQEKIGKVIDTPAQASLFLGFRQSHPEFLVIRLRGDVPSTLREQFIVQLEQALKEHTTTQKVTLPFWYQKAEDLLTRLTPVELDKANLFLANHETDVPSLLDDLHQRNDNIYDLCRNLFTELHGVAPDFGGEVSLSQVIQWATRKYCGEGNPLGGLLVLFDEFSLYIQRHAQRNAVGELQDLLNGIEDQEGLAAFVAFAQHDPLTVAKNAVKGAQILENLEKELTRITRKIFLYSLMESVINSYLIQPETEWRNFRGDQNSRGPLARASNLTMELFSQRYENTLNWDTERFDEIITKGCFPLHPLTTAFLCDLKLHGVVAQGSNPRTVLGFIFNLVNDKKDQQAIIETQINWVLPIDLVEYFGDYLPEIAFRLYENAKRNLIPDAPPEQRKLLEALLLQEAAKLSMGRDSQIEFLTEATGINSIDVARQHLKQLADARCVRFDPVTRINSFYSVGADPHRLDELLQNRLEGKPFTEELLSSLNSEETKTIKIDVNWGHPEEWEAHEKLLLKDGFSVSKLRQLFPSFDSLPSGELREGFRGGFVWLLAKEEDEVLWFRQNAAKILDEAFPNENPLPLLLMLPQTPCLDLLENYHKKKELEKFSADDRHEVGIDIYEQEKIRLAQKITTEMSNLRGELITFPDIPRESKIWVAPAPYRATLQALGKISLYQILKECYRIAYRNSPPEFFTVYKSGQNKLRDATRDVASVLLRNSLSSNRDSIAVNPIARDLCQKFLWQRWHLITADYRIQEPGDQHVLDGWNVFEQHFPGGVKDVKVRDALLTLFNPSYGYDYNTLTLLLCAWIGYHLHDIEITLLGRRAKLDDLTNLLTEGGKKFIQQICCTQPLGISRRDQGQMIRDVKALIQRANRDTFTQDEAIEAITSLQSYCVDQGLQPELCESATQAAENLNKALGIAQAYDANANEITDIVHDERNLLELINIQHKIITLPNLGNVKQNTPSPTELEVNWRERLESMVKDECTKLQNIQRMAQVELHESQLDDLKKHLRKAKLTELSKKVDQALEIIKLKAAELEAQEHEAPIQAEIRAMDLSAQLITLYEYRKRLLGIDKFSSTTLHLKQERLNSIEREINQVEAFANGLISSVEGLKTFADTTKWQQQYLRQINRYQETPFQKDLDAANLRVQHLEGIFDQMETLSKNFPATPEEASSAITKLDALNNQFEAWVTEEQKQSIILAKKEIDQHIQQKEAEGHKWLLTLEVDFGKGEIPKVFEKLKTSPAFLSKADKIKLQSLQEQVQQQLDKNVVARIETQFRQINDPAIREQCVALLMKILKEK